MKIAVTGGSGRIGRSVLETLVARGHDVLIYPSTVQVYGFCDLGHVPPLQKGA